MKIDSVKVIHVLYLMEQNKFCPIFNIFYPIWIKFGKGDVHKNDILLIVIFVKIGVAKSVKSLRKARTYTLTFLSFNHGRLQP